MLIESFDRRKVGVTKEATRLAGRVLFVARRVNSLATAARSIATNSARRSRNNACTRHRKRITRASRASQTKGSNVTLC